MITRSFRLYASENQKQHESFYPSCKYDWSNGNTVRLFCVENADVTKTNEYTLVHVTSNTAMGCFDELAYQLADGILKHCKVGKIVEVTHLTN
jgi:hypothetical protein